MNQMFGMSVEQVRALSGQLDAAGNEVDQILMSLTKGLSATPWQGNDRDRFEREWSSQHTAGLRQAADALRAAAAAARQNADAQTRASGR